ncbi:hypothetical protein EI200_22745 [Peribacillus simplex]|uniref:hypothetical protein n=1 Tax=Peribacillus simplex TaxID=1478 RepID=UPI000F63A858|nr:hypothetical protein [Peribacillus simplex]RRN67506.1 hypothetical protein EI200_22745 [Peribacillus simplex]
MKYSQIRYYVSFVNSPCYKTSELIEECPDTGSSQATYPFFKCSLPINIVFSKALNKAYYVRRGQFDADDIICCAGTGTDQEPLSFLRQEINTVISPFSSNQIKLPSFPESGEVSPRGKIS